MKEAARKYGALVLALIAVLGVCLLFSVRKSGMFIDEIYTYGLSNSHFAPFLADMKGGDLVDKVLTRQDLLDYVTVNDGEGFDFASVYDNQVRDVHPPLYYWLFNIVSSLTPNVFSKWTGLALDLVLYLGCLLLLWRLVYELYDSRDIAAAAVILYGISGLGLSTMLMIRMYVLMTLWTLLLALLVARQLREPRPLRDVWIGLCILLGLLTQYYFVFYAFFLCAAYVLLRLGQKRWKDAGRFALCAFAGVGLLVLLFPAAIRHLTADKLVSGGNALEQLSTLSQYRTRLVFFYHEARHGLKIAVFVSLFALLGLLLCFKRLRADKGDRHREKDSLLILVPAFVTFILVALISPVDEQRYIYNLAPLFVAVACLLLYLLRRTLGDYPGRELWQKAALALMLAAAVLQVKSTPPKYLYPQAPDYYDSYAVYNELAEEHREDPVLYLTDNYSAPVTQDLEQLLFFRDLLVTNDPDSPALDRYLEDAGYPDECVVYLDVSAFWGSGYDPDLMLPALLDSTEYNSWQPLYVNQLSATYLLSK